MVAFSGVHDMREPALRSFCRLGVVDLCGYHTCVVEDRTYHTGSEGHWREWGLPSSRFGGSVLCIAGRDYVTAVSSVRCCAWHDGQPYRTFKCVLPGT